MSEKFKTILLVFFCVLGLLHLLRELNKMRNDMAYRAETAELAKEELAATKLRNYLDCKFGSGVCDRLYPESAKRVKDAQESTQTETEK